MARDRRRTAMIGGSGLLPVAVVAAALATATPAQQQVEKVAEEVEGTDVGEEALGPGGADVGPGDGPLSPVSEEPELPETLGAPERAGDKGVSAGIFAGGGGTASEMLHVPVIQGLFPGPVPVRPTVENPVADDPGAAQRGMKYFNQFNCIGCHAPNGAGGMGPSLSNAMFIYGGDPENIYLSILQGRPAGMPAWGGALPDHVIWDLVAYIRSISKKPSGPWGATVSADGFEIEQVPAEYLTTTDPWKYTTPFSYGQAPFEKPKGSPPHEAPPKEASE